MAWSVENKTKLGVAFTLLILLVNAFLSFKATKTLIANDQWVRHTYEVLAGLESTMSTLTDAETGEHGFLITGLDSYLEPYEAALREIDGNVRRLEELTADNASQTAKVAALKQKIAKRLEVLREGVDLRRAGDAEGARQLIVSGVGKRMMDELRGSINEMETTEMQLLDRRIEESRNSQRNAVVTFVVANLVACGVLLATAVMTLRGIDARKRAERRIREQRHLFEVTLSSIADGVVVCDIDGLVTFLNPVAENLTGWTCGEAAGQPLSKVFNIVNEDTRQAVPNPALRAVRDGVIVGLANHTVLITKYGTETPIDDSGAPIKTADGKMLGAVLVFRDITARRRAESERWHLLTDTQTARERAEIANRSKDEFLAILSHELRTPLTSVFGWVQLLRNRSIDEEMKENALEVIDRNIRAQAKLIDDLLNVSQIVAGTFEIHKQLIDPVQAVKSAIDSARPAAAAKDIALGVHAQENVPEIEADVMRLQQIVGNLLSNAIKFTPRHGSVKIDIRSDGSDLKIVVQDTGQGIPSQFLPNVFNRFTQADQSATRLHGGLGLGLALVRQLVELHGGTVRAESPGVGQGSTFTLTFPVPIVQERRRQA